MVYFVKVMLLSCRSFHHYPSNKSCFMVYFK